MVPSLSAIIQVLCLLQLSSGVCIRTGFRITYSSQAFSHVALESRVVTGYLAAASALIIILQAVYRLAVPPKTQQAVVASNYVQSHGGWTILAFQVLRLLSNDALFSLAIFTAVRSDWNSWGDNAVVMSSVSTSFSLITVVRG
jgi:hypothetical protein